MAVQVVSHCCRLAPGNALELVRRYDVVVDASDNAFTRYLLSDACAVRAPAARVRRRRSEPTATLLSIAMGRMVCLAARSLP